MSWPTVGEIRKLLEGKADTDQVPIYVKYGDVANKYIFVRVDDVTTRRPAGALINPEDPPGICLCLSLVDGDMIWDGLCPSCADRVSDYMDNKQVEREDAIEQLRAVDAPTVVDPNTHPRPGVDGPVSEDTDG